MFNKKVSKKAKIIIFFVAIIAGVWFVFDILPIGPGLPSPKEMPNWYIPAADDLKGRSSCSSYFSNNISSYYNAGNYSDGVFINAWYFDVESNFLTGEYVLYHYLKENGNLSQQKINISTEIEELYKRGESENNTTWETFVPRLLNITEYRSRETSGYFIVHEKPFLETREDYFIVYYGTTDTENFTEQKPTLKKLIAKSYLYGKIHGLKESK
jgi:hypothetical protein